MSKISIVISQEYRNRVAKKSFILLTFLMPLLFAAIITVPIWLASIDSEEEKVITVVDQTGLYTEFFRGIETDICTFDVVSNEPIAVGESFEVEKYRNDSSMLMVISDDLSRNPSAIAIYSDKQVPREVSSFVESSLEEYVENCNLEAYNIPDIKKMIEDAKANIDVTTYKWDKNGETHTSDADIATFVGMFVTMLIYMFIFISGSQVMSAVVQEKANRIVEVMVCSVKPWEMMWGKIIAVALVCLTQMLLWVVMTGVVVLAFSGIAGLDMTALSSSATTGMAAGDNSEMTAIMTSLTSMDWGYISAMFIIYFIGGYLLYAAMFAAIGASVDNEQDTNQFMMPITVVVLFALYAGIYSAGNPDGPLAFWCSIIPFTSPIVMMVRIPFDVPVWQVALSLALLLATIVGTIYLSAKIYRIGILMYGKKPSWREIMKWLKY